MKPLPKILLALYLLALLWLVLFKFSFDFTSVLLDHQTRSLNLVPFAGALQGNVREMVDNFIVFVPFGLLLGVNLKRTSFWEKLTLIFMFSLAAEIVQFILAIGATDVTDVIANTFGGLFGLVLYALVGKYVDNNKLDRFIVIAGVVLLVALILIRSLFLRVRY